jgi:ATP-dependent DNA helicase DinG
LFEARSQRLTSQGRSPFADHALPEAAVALKQGAGRLIRSENDRGILVVCDTRLLTMSYGKRLMAALPPMRRVSGRDQFQTELSALAQASPEFPPT